MKVSILMITYNHEKFIAQALDSVLMQRVSFDYEIVIGEDCSQDNTRRILLDYQELHPDRIRLLLPEANLGMQKNFLSTLAACRGQYIALLEGDDYWTSPDKLQKQVEFLDSNSDCVLCCHQVSRVYEKADQPVSVFPPHPKPRASLEDLLAGNFIQTCSVLLRGPQLQDYPFWLNTVKMVDWPFFILHAQLGSIACLPENWAVYRVHAGGIWSGLAQIDVLSTNLKVLEHLRSTLCEKYTGVVRAHELNNAYFLACEYALRGNMINARTLGWRCIRERAHNRYVSLFQLTRLFIRLYVPGVNRLSVAKHVHPAA